MSSVILIVHVLVALALIGLVLLQHGKGADAGAAFGSGASATVFGSRGSGSFMTRLTAALATVFFITSLTLAYMSGQRTVTESVVDKLQQPATTQEKPTLTEEAPGTDVPGITDPALDSQQN